MTPSAEAGHNTGKAAESSDEHAASGTAHGGASASNAEMPQLFNTTRPRDVVEGATSAVSSVVKGFVGGVATLVAAPIVGAKEGGAGGFVKGVAVSSSLALMREGS